MKEAIEKACEPYGGLQKNRFCTLPNHTPTISIAGDIDLRYRMRQQSTTTKPLSMFLHDLKKDLHTKLDNILRDTRTRMKDPPAIVSNAEQQGYLSVHVLCIPPKGQSFLDISKDLLSSLHAKKRKRSRQRPFVTQGGDPRVNLEHRLKSQGYQWFTLADAENIPPPIKAHPAMAPMEFHVIVFRRPIYLFGYYTKARRDVSQTPFVVVENKESKTLGVTSVEEEIVRPIQKLLGVSTWNNAREGSVQYGMCKFHASGREDMDVRMLIRPGQPSTNKGRPFCIQMIDSLRPIESEEQLKGIVDAVNAGNGESSPSWYGTNPMGVGLAPQLHLVHSSAFSGLQADTEAKVKHYGCHCWSEKELPENWTFQLENPPLTIQQRTPLRVLHRRANLTRDRQVHAASATRVDNHHFRLELSTQAGAYVKEFVHGDLGWTTPSMATILGTKTNILLLDCEGIELDDIQE